MLASKISSLASLWCSVVAWVVLATVGRIEMSHGDSAVSIFRDRHAMNVVDCHVSFISTSMSHIPKGPYSASAGKPWKLTVIITPIPSAGTVPVIDPVITLPVSGSKLESGRTASKLNPAVFCCATASPSWPVKPGFSGPSFAGQRVPL